MIPQRMRFAWHALFGGDIGPIGWCGSDGYWWTRPCPHYQSDSHGCGWFDGVSVYEPPPPPTYSGIA
jgi:hypothetical protein